MIKVKGKYNEAIIYATTIEDLAKEQVRAVCDLEVFKDSKIRIMPDVHAGAGCTIGTTMTLKDASVPNMVGVDIGCGMECVEINEKEIDFKALDELIRKEIPYGRNVRDVAHLHSMNIHLDELRCAPFIDGIEKEVLAIGSLGGGNHFIEVDKDEEGNLFLVIHSGSRHLGKVVAEYYQRKADEKLHTVSKGDIQKTVEEYKKQGREKEIASALKRLNEEKHSDVPKGLSYCTGKLFEDYIHDMKIVQEFADLNRKAMMDTILKGMNLTLKDHFSTIHNYIDTDAMILRKGAVSARRGQKLLIPMNMRDGSLICIGKGNEDFNCSAPHGAGRLMSRTAAFNNLSVEEFRKEMEGIYSTTVSNKTLDESPMAYKSMEEIIENIGLTADIRTVIRPVYNFKAEE